VSLRFHPRIPLKNGAPGRLIKFLFIPALFILTILFYISCGRRGVEFEVTRAVLDNGLRVLLHEDHSVPAVSYQTFYRVGSRNEREGIRGISQLIEHMMFQGTDRFRAGEFDSLLENNGGSCNASTSKDMTVYSAEFHRDLLERVIELEADRMRNLRLSQDDIEKEKSIISEERLRVVDNSVRGRMREKLFALAFREHPYRWPAIGTPGDIESLTRKECLEYYRQRYLPANAVVVAAGDFETEEALALIRKYYGRIQQEEPPADYPVAEPDQTGVRRDTLDVKWRLPVVKMGFRAPPAGSEDIYPLDILQMILDGGRNARLPSLLVNDLSIAVRSGAFFPWRIDPALFIVTIRMREGQDPEEGIEAFYEIIDDIRENGIAEEELNRAKKMIEAGYIRSMESISDRASRMGRYEILLGDYRKMYRVQEIYRQISGADVAGAARKYFIPEKSSVVILREAGGSN